MLSLSVSLDSLVSGLSVGTDGLRMLLLSLFTLLFSLLVCWGESLSVKGLGKAGMTFLVLVGSS